MLPRWLHQARVQAPARPGMPEAAATPGGQSERRWQARGLRRLAAWLGSGCWVSKAAWRVRPATSHAAGTAAAQPPGLSYPKC